MGRLHSGVDDPFHLNHGRMDQDKHKSIGLHRLRSKGVNGKALSALLLGLVLLVVVAMSRYASDDGLSHDYASQESPRPFWKDSHARQRRLLSSSCQRTCGRMSIPYPFGLSAECAWNEFFVLKCNFTRGINATGGSEMGSWPYLVNVATGSASGLQWNISNQSSIPYTYSSNTFQVLNLSNNKLVIDTVGVKAMSCLYYGDVPFGNASILLPNDGPYRLSDQNILIAVGCESEVSYSTTSIDDTYNDYLGNCGPNSCNNLQNYYRFCGAYDCCTTSIKPSLDFYFSGRGSAFAEFSACGYGSLLLPDSFQGPGELFGEWTYGTELAWALPVINETRSFNVCANSPAILTASADYACTSNTNTMCNFVSVLNETSANLTGYFCSCNSGSEGDGYRDGVGCTVWKKKKNLLEILLPSVLGGALVIVTIISSFTFVVWQLRKRIVELQKVQDELSRRKVQPPFFSYANIKIATRNFRKENKIGQGGFGIVYKGILGDGSTIAVKKLINLATATQNSSVLNDFLNEVVLITGIKHKNLIQLRGCCIKDQERILVYDFAENGNLEQALHDKDDSHKPLDLITRIGICFGIARGLLYLHDELEPRIVHRDIKPANILLDLNFNPKIADFGLARFAMEESAFQMTKKAGTWGYVAPEYELSDKMDVFSYGILVLEIMSGRRSIDYSLPAETSDLRIWARKLYKSNTLLDLLPDQLRKDCQRDQITNLLKLAIKCTALVAEHRPSMFEVLTTLARIFVEEQIDFTESEHQELLNFSEEDLHEPPHTRVKPLCHQNLEILTEVEKEDEFPLVHSHATVGTSLSSFFTSFEIEETH